MLVFRDLERPPQRQQAVTFTVEAARNDFREAWDATLSEIDCRPTQSS